MSTTNNTTLSNQLYPVANGVASSNAFVWQFLARDPTPQDVNYPIQKFWLNTSDNTVWFLKNFITTNGVITANWIFLATGSIAIEKFLMQTGTSPVVADASSQVTFNGAVVAAGTNPVRTDGTGANTMALEVQISQAVASTDPTGVTKIGLAAFNSDQFTVDANGFVSFTGTGATDTLTGNSGGAVSPTGNNINTVGTGSITIVGNPGTSTLTTQLTGLTNHNVLVGAGTATITKVAPSATSGVPLISQGAAADPAFGTAVVAGGGTGAVTLTGILTGNGTSPVTANAVTQHGILIGGASNAASSLGVATNGQLPIGSTGVDPVLATLTAGSGISITNGAGSITVAVSGSSVGETITGNSGGALSPTAGNWNILGLSGSKTSGSGSTLTIKSPPYADQGGSTTVTLNSGSFATAAITLTLPASAGLADGDLFEFVCTSASALVIQSVGAQKIRIGTLLSSAAGTATSTSIGDSVILRFRASDGFFYATSVIGTWLVA